MLERIISKVFMLLFVCNTVTAQVQWTAVGNLGFSAAGIDFPAIAFDSKGVPYVGFQDNSAGGKATVMKYDGTNWVVVGSKGFSDSGAFYLSLAIDGNDVPYIVCQQANTFDARLDVMKYNGTNWVQVGAGFPGIGYRPEIVIDKTNNIYIYYSDWQQAYKATIMKYDGANWTTVGVAGFSAGEVAFGALATDNSGTVYVAYTEDPWGTGKVTAKKYDGTNWATVGSAGFSAGYGFLPSLSIDKKGILYVSYQDGTDNNKATVMKFDGTGWTTVGSAAFTTGSFLYGVSAVDSNDVPHIAFANALHGDKATVMKYDGNNWVTVGNGGFTPTYIAQPSLGFNKDNTPHIAYVARGFGGDKAAVMKFECPYPPSGIDICAVLTDTATGNNMIIWDGTANTNVDSYRIYREDNGSYVQIGSVAGTVQSFTDASVNPATNSHKYKLTLLDKCGRTMHIDSSTMHRSVRLIFNYLLNGQASITWNRYEGINNVTYKVMRSNNSGSFTAIDSFSITGSDTTYIDNNPPSGSNRYRIDISLTNPCSSGAVTYDKVTSNVVTSWNTGIEKTVTNGSISVAPNPADKELRVTAAETIVKIEVYNYTGQKLVSGNSIDKKETIIDISGLPPGMYILRVNNSYNISFIKR